MPVDPASLQILQYPDPVLRQRARAVDEITAEVRAAATRMIEMMFEAEGIGLAAPQVGLPWRLFVAHIPPGGEGTEERRTDTDPASATSEPTVYINPVISNPVGPLTAAEEGCLSLPDITGDVYRPSTVTITAQDLQGRSFRQSGTGLLARCWQHEFDHLEGVLILDRMTQISRLKSRSAVRRLEKARL